MYIMGYYRRIITKHTYLLRLHKYPNNNTYKNIFMRFLKIFL